MYVKFAANIVIVLASIFVGLTIGEITLRYRDISPWTYAEPLPSIQKMWSVYDPVLGWRMSPGDYSRQAGFNNIVTSEGARATSTTPDKNAPRIILLGGSFTFGSGVPDEQTYAWKLQSAFPDYQVQNFGTGGYGTYQSLLRAEEYFASSRKADYVIYGYLNHHQHRNVANASWMRSIEQYSKRYNHTYIPYCTWDEQTGDIARQPSTRHPRFPLREQLALSSFLETVYLDYQAYARNQTRKKVTSRLLEKLQELSAANGAKFITLIVDINSPASDERKGIFDVMNSANIDYIDCMASPNPDLSLWDGHPSAQRHSQLAQCLIDGINQRELLDVSSSG